MTTRRGFTAGLTGAGRNGPAPTVRASAAGVTDAAGADGSAGAEGSATGAVAAGEEAQYLDACIADVEGWLGRELTAYLAGAESPAELTGWRRAADLVPASAAGRRLRTASEVVELFASAGHGTHAQAWLREVSASTDGRSPADLVRHAPNEALLDLVREAAERHLRPARPTTQRV